jgi:hypothetical protein
MTFLELLKTLKPTRRGSFCRMHDLRKQLRTLCKKKGLTRLELLWFLRIMVSSRHYYGQHPMLDEVVVLVQNIGSTCDVKVERVLMYLAGYLPHLYMVAQLNRAKLSLWHIAH